MYLSDLNEDVGVAADATGVADGQVQSWIRAPRGGIRHAAARIRRLNTHAPHRTRRLHQQSCWIAFWASCYAKEPTARKQEDAAAKQAITRAQVRPR